MIKEKDLNKLIIARNILKNSFSIPNSGKIINGEEYLELVCSESLNDIQNAIKTFANAFGLEVVERRNK